MTTTQTDRLAGLVGNQAIKLAALCATTGNVTLSGEQTIDGQTTSGSRVLVWQQSNSVQNGLYLTDTGAWVRTADFDGNQDVTKGSLVHVYAGTVHGGAFFHVTVSAPVIDTDAVTFAKVSMLQGISVRDYGAVGNNVADDTTAFRNAIAAAISTGIRKVYIDGGTYNLTSAIDLTSAVALIGVGKSSTSLVRNFSPAADNIGLFNIKTNGILMQDMYIASNIGTAGGCLVSMVGTAGNLITSDFCSFRNIIFTYGAINTFKYALYIDGHLRAGGGVRDTHFTDIEIFGGTAGAIYADGVVNFSFTGATYAGGSTSAKLNFVCTTPGNIQNYYININAQAIDTMAWSNVFYGTARIGVIPNGIFTNDAACYGCVVIADFNGYAPQQNWTRSIVIGTNGAGAVPIINGMTISSAGAATVNSLNGLTVSTSTGTLTVANGKTLTYDEGTWSPTFTCSVSNPTVGYNTQTGVYNKSGDLVHARIYVFTNSLSGGSGDLRISLPFAAVGGVNCHVGFVLGWTGNQSPVALDIVNGNSYASFIAANGTSADNGMSGTLLTISALTNAAYLVVEFSYRWR